MSFIMSHDTPTTDLGSILEKGLINDFCVDFEF